MLPTKWFSDATYGWNGFMNGLTVYYLNINSTLQDETHSFPLIPTLTTIVTLQNVKGKTDNAKIIM